MVKLSFGLSVDHGDCGSCSQWRSDDGKAILHSVALLTVGRGNFSQTIRLCNRCYLELIKEINDQSPVSTLLP